MLELANQVTWMRSNTNERDFVVAGDFNYSGESKYMKKFAATSGLVQVDPNKKSTFRRDYTGYSSSYDHIYLSQQHTVEYIPSSADTLDTTTMIYGSRTPPNMAKSKKELSDHLPVFAVFRVDGVDDD